MSAPILVMSFNRPDYLEQVLRSLAAQQDCDITKREIFLFQDGQRNPFSGRSHGAAEPIEQSIAAFAEIIPFGTPMISPHNLGVALNFDRAERFVFEERQDPAAIFLEDDMVLSPHYIATMDRLLDKHADDERIGYVGAYGDYTLSLEEQRRLPDKLITLHHNWAFGLYRRHWLRAMPMVEEYLALVRNIDYRARNHQQIWDLYASWGYGPISSSQDAAKTMACVRHKTIKIKTRPVLGHYIGARGLHFSPAAYEKRGYANTVMYPDPVLEFEPVTDQLYRSILGELTRWAGKPKPPTAEPPPATPAPAPATPPAA